jgi:hypothetical protein
VKQEFEVSVEELLRTLKRRGIPLASEMGAFITLEVCEQIIDRPAQVSTNEVAINEIGEVLCASKATQTNEAEAVRSLLVLLGDLLVCAAPGVPTMLLELVEHGPSEGQLTLDRLRDDLEACLLPLNRGATRRVLARLLREARKAGPSLRTGAEPTAADIDAQFDALLGAAGIEVAATEAAVTLPRAAFLEPTTTPRAARAVAQFAAAPRAASRFDETPITDVLAGGAFAQRYVNPAGAVNAQQAVELADSLEPGDERAEQPPESQAARREPLSAPRLNFDDDLVEGERRSSAGLWVFGLCLVAALGLTTAYLVLGRDGARNALGLLPQSKSTETIPSVPRPAKPSVGELHVTSNPTRAQVLLLIGTGPALATDLPLGVAQEFVALADGYAPARAVVPADAAWEDVDGKPRYELAIQGVRTNGDAIKSGLGKTLLPQDVGTPQARLGSVRVVTTPKGAKVYQLIGFTPDVRVENLPLDQSYEVLVYLDGHAPLTRQLTAADFQSLDGRRVAEIDLALAAPKAH